MAASDVDAVARIGYQAWLSNRPHKDWFRPTVERRVEQSFQDFAARPDAEVIVCLVADVIVGWGARDSRQHPGNQSFGWDYISDLWILPAFQGQGLGTSILRELMARMRTEGIEIATIEAVAANEGALKLYRQIGFHEIWRGEIFSQALGLDTERVLLEKELA